MSALRLGEAFCHRGPKNSSRNLGHGAHGLGLTLRLVTERNQ